MGDEHVLCVLAEKLAHRGPDAQGVWLAKDGRVGLGHRRLVVIDTSEASNQPFADPSGRYRIVFNGEIYNFRDIRGELAARGTAFRTSGDTEVLLEAYRAWGPECLARLQGMFAFALWDDAERQLFAARDRLGKKPFFFYETPGHGLVFSSEPQVLRHHPGVPFRVDPDAVREFLRFNYVVSERHLQEGVRVLPPGHALSWRDGQVRVRRYWDLASFFLAPRREGGLERLAGELTEIFDDSVRKRLVSDVPLGAFLSGGVDSSAVVASMRQQLPPAAVRTFSFGFREATFSELDEAREAARHLETVHVDDVLQPNPDAVFEALRAAAREPLADSSYLPMYFLSRLARKHVTVALSGDGGDECFGGYETIRADLAAQALGGLRTPARWALLALARLLPVRFDKVSLDYKLRAFAQGLALSAEEAHASWRAILSLEDEKSLFGEAIRSREDSSRWEPFTRHTHDVAGCGLIDRLLYIDFKTWLPADILVKVDRATMAHGLEARAPFLDHRLVEFAATLPAELKARLSRLKIVLKESQRSRLPSWLVARKKVGFNSPVSHWFAGPFRQHCRDTLRSPALGPWVNRDAVEKLLEEHCARRADHGLKLLGLMCLSLWLESSEG